MQRSGRSCRNLRSIATILALAVAPAGAEETPRGTPPQNESQTATIRPRELDSRQLELRGVEDTIGASEEQRRQIEADIENIRNDRARLLSALLATTEKVNAAAQKISETETRLETLTGSEDAIRRSLESRRDVIAEVLASLQRMGRTPPPALLVEPEDMLQAIRTSMLLGAVLPEMRAETEALAADLADLVRLGRSIAAEHDRLAKEAAELGLERQRLAALVDARQNALGTAERALGAERARAQDLARQASSLKELIARMESELGGAKHAAEEAHKADEARKTAELESGHIGAKPNASLFKDAARLAPAVAFAEAKGLLPMPAVGTVLRNFGSSDGFGGTEKGLFIATRVRAIVASPSDGWVAFAGPYRTYGQLLIINAGQGYYVVLAGMERINVEVGQFVLVGEPVATMGDGAVKTAAAIAIGAAQPILYVEFRKDGAAIDPGPWWAKPDIQKVRG
ncbi:MAG: murein hydrolase activator EnvC family protein [Beijerinckiaceae bacterium]